MTSPRIYVVCLWGVIALFALYKGVAQGSVAAWWLVAALVPPLIVFVWCTVDRAALERRIRRLEARSEIGDERRVVAHTDLAKVEHMLHEIERRVAQVEEHEAGATESGGPAPKPILGHSKSSVAGVISINAE